jgi:LDH2 family malate/lactate/ureidoglycolate dehydrogenase
MPAPYEKHRAQLKAILLAWGMPEDDAEATAEILSWADLHGVDSHGISMIPGYDRLRRSGRANMAARPRIIKETPVSALVDGDGGLATCRRTSPCKSRSTRQSSPAWRSPQYVIRPILAPLAITR